MNFKTFILLALLKLATAAPIPIPEPLHVVEVTEHTTTTVPVAKVIIGPDFTSTIQLTTLPTATIATAETANIIDNKNAAPSPDPAPSPNPTPVAELTTSQSVSIDENGVAHVRITLDKKIIVDQNGHTITVSTQPLPQDDTPKESRSLVQNDNVKPPENAQTTVVNETSTPSAAPETSTPSAAPETSTPSAAPETSTPSAAPEKPTSTGTSETSTSVATTETPATSTTSTTPKKTSTTQRKNYTTTWANGEVFYSYIEGGLVSPINVAPIVAATTTTLSNTAEATQLTGSLSLTSSDDKILLPTLTIGLPKDKNVQVTMANPATVSMTNKDVATTSVVIPTPSSTSTTEAPTSSPNDPGSGLVVTPGDNGAISDPNTPAKPEPAPIDSSKYLTKVPGTIVYSPYNNDGTCKDYKTVSNDLQLIASKGIKQIRVYGTDCNYMTTVLTVAKFLGIKVNQGFWISAEGVNSIDEAVDNLITYINSGAASYGWEIFSFITVGNEAIIANYCTVPDLIAKIAEVKGKLRNAGYQGDITTSEPPVIFENHPELCTQSEIDFVGVNPHSYFDVYSSAEESGSFVAGQIGIVKQFCGDKRIFVTETGYPSAGAQNGKNIPSADNQRIAVQSILDIVGEDVTILTTFEDYWKAPGPYNIEQHFGIIQILPDRS
ncbi:hypothetical protein CANINC_004857 [Pichia inconspicua]|uniref:Glycoside hydrolase family 17 protein n=1 Tax=Pichia inconspicua TaxID=52247 RepID=A0A4V4NF34_9ASCO|nr:hypothetical protein CANINC_004857 [[Candida] inconspicua]